MGVASREAFVGVLVFPGGCCCLLAVVAAAPPVGVACVLLFVLGVLVFGCCC